MCLLLRRKPGLKSTRKRFTNPQNGASHVPQRVSTNTFPFLTLPAEVRDCIYGHAVDWNILDGTGRLQKHFTPPTILPLNRQICQEALAVLLKKPLVLQTETFNCALPFERIVEQRVLARIPVVVFPIVWHERLRGELQLDCTDGSLWGPWEEYIVQRLTLVTKHYKTKQQWIFKIAGEEGNVKKVKCKVSDWSVVRWTELNYT
ncbi:hypothetical protein LTS18_009071 [Coniosporium uncinatum]|uniref:Uncharacterized protein n=1 Tax=Coniosporium uncinatum TaxID=93489 RepID=A0ACC3DMH3_9PEZI|nr:hypothetical protein LTS18_009071 [Coniosporium uncinatum]